MNETVIAFRREVLKTSVADLCRRAGWESVTCRVMEVLVDLMERYITKLSTTTKAYSELYNRQNPNLTDVWLSYKQNGVDLPELHEYLENLDEQLPSHDVPLFPAPRFCLQNEEKVCSSKHKHNKHKTDSITSSNTSSTMVALERKASATDVQAVLIKEKPAKARSSGYQMHSIVSVDSRAVDAGVPSTGASASRRNLPHHLSSNYPSFDYTHNQALDMAHSAPHHRAPLTPTNHQYADNSAYNTAGHTKHNKRYSGDEIHADDDYNDTLPLDGARKHNGWEGGRRKEGRRRGLEGGRLDKHNNFAGKNKVGRLPTTLQHSTPTAALIANLKKTRKATIKEAFLAKKRLHSSEHNTTTTASPSHPLHHTPLASPKKSLSAKLSSKKYKTAVDDYASVDYNYPNVPVKKKPGRKPKRKNVIRAHKNNNAYNTYNTNVNLMHNPLDESSTRDHHHTLLHTPDVANSTDQIKQEVWSNSDQQQSHNTNNSYSNNNSNNVPEVKEEVVTCNDVNEEVLPWTDAENSPAKNNNNNDDNYSHNNNNNNPSFNNSDTSFVNVCDKSNTPLNNNYNNNNNDHLPNSPTSTNTRLSISNPCLHDVSKVTGLELILGSKQDPSNTDFDANPHNVEPQRLTKRKAKKKSKRQKREERNAHNNNNNIKNNNNDYTDSYNNNDKSRLDAHDHKQLAAFAPGGEYERKGGDDGYEGGDRGDGEDNLSTLVSVAVDQREKIHDTTTTPQTPTNLTYPSNNTPLNNNYNTPYNNNADNLNSTFPPVNLSGDIQKKKKKKKSKKRRHEEDVVTDDDVTKKPKMDDHQSLPKLTLKFGGNTVCGGKTDEVAAAPPAPPPAHSNRPKGPIKLVIKPFSALRRGLPSPSHHSGSSMLPSSRSQSPDDLARLAVGQRKLRPNIYDSDHSAMRRSPIYSDSPSPPHAPQYSTPVNPQYSTPHNFSHTTPHHNLPYTPIPPSTTAKKSRSYNPVKSTSMITNPGKVSKSLKTPATKGKSKRSDKAGKITQPNGEVIWICPTCGFPDNGSPMIGCDKCDDWYHWVCVNITEEPPEEVSWFCTFCINHASSTKFNNKRGRPPGKK